MPRTWKTPQPVPDALLFDLLDVPPCIVQTLYNRGLTTAEGILRFLGAGDEEPQGDPYALTGMTEAVQRLRAAIANDERIAVYGDFDVDGICSAALLMQVLAGLGARAQVYIPHRVEEGYGLNKAAITRLADDGIRLLITADCGTSSIDDIAHAGSLGMDVIVTDHHHVHGPFPPAVAVVNPRRADSTYPCRELAGVGVAYKLAQALLAQQAEEAATYLDLVALGTVVDVAPLVGENRTLVRRGLTLMRTSPRPGLRALMEQARIRPEAVDTGSLGFAIGPRLNAAGRLDTARTSYDLLLAASGEEAMPLAKKLEEQNQERQQLLELALASARLQAAQQAQERRLIFVASEQYLAGIVGLVAGRLVEEFYRPAVAVERGIAFSRGSCRSVSEFHMARALAECGDLLERYGGHAQAAGFTVTTARLPELEQRLAAIAARELEGRDLEPVIVVDSVIPISQANWDTLRWLRRMEPFGPGNPAPVLQSNNVCIRRARQVGSNHLRLHVTDGRVTWDAIAFRQGAWATELREGDCVDLVYNLEAQIWNGEHSLQLVIKDLRRRTGS